MLNFWFYYFLISVAFTLFLGPDVGASERAITHALDYQAGEVRFFNTVTLPLGADSSIPEKPEIRVRYCNPLGGAQARVLNPVLAADSQMRMVVYVPAMSRLCAEIYVVPSGSLAIDGAHTVDAVADQRSIESLVARIGPMGPANAPQSEGGAIAGETSFLAALVIVLVLILTLAVLLFRQIKGLQRFFHLARYYRRVVNQRVNPGFVIREEIRVTPRGDPKPKIFAIDVNGKEVAWAPTTTRRADILRELLGIYPEMLSRYSGDRETINAVEIARIRQDLAPLLGKLMAKPLLQNVGNSLRIDGQLYQPPPVTSTDREVRP